MARYKITIEAKEDLIRIYHYGVLRFGEKQADKYYESFFKYFEIIAESPYSFESVNSIKTGYRPCVCVCGSDSIFFKINEDTVDIMAIVGKQDLEKKNYNF